MGPTRLIRLAGLVLLGACAGPGDGGRVGSAAPLVSTERDSTGVQILESPADAVEHTPLIARGTTPLATLGEADTDVDLSRVSSAVVLRNGGLALHSHGWVHVYSPAEESLEKIVGMEKDLWVNAFNTASLSREQRGQP